MTNNKNTTLKFWASLVIGIFVFCLGLYEVFFIKVKDDATWYTSGVLISLGAGLFAFLLTGHIKIVDNSTIEGIKISAGGGCAIFIVVLILFLKFTNPPSQQTNLKIQVQDENGTSILAKEDKVLRVSWGKNTKKLNLDENGEVSLNLLATTDSLQIEILDPNWQLAHLHRKTTSFKIPTTGILTILLELVKERCYLNGRVEFEDKKLRNLADITVRAAGVHTLTDAQGYYHLEIPKVNCLENLFIEAFNDTYNGTIWSNTASPCDIKLIRK